MVNNKHRRRRPNKPVMKDDYIPPYDSAVLEEPIQNLRLREETEKLLLGAGVNTIGDVLKREEKDFYRILTFKKKNLMDVKFVLKRRKLELKPTPEKPDAGDKENKEGREQAVKKQSGNAPEREKRPRDEKKRREKGSPNTMGNVRPEKPPRPVHVPVKEIPDLYVKVNKGGKWGFKDRQGKQVVAPIYDEVFSYREDFCCVEKDEKFGFINREGEEVIPIMYDLATSFSEGYACVFKGEKCGYIDKENQTVIEFKFDAGTPVVDGECRVKKEGRWGELHMAEGISEIRWII